MNRSFVVNFDEALAVHRAGTGEVLQDASFAVAAAGRIQAALDLASRRAAKDAAKRFAHVWRKVAAALAKEWRQTLPQLASRGWYLDGGLSPEKVRIVVEMMNNERGKDADHLLIAYFDHHSRRIEAEMAAAFPLRKALFRTAFTAHRQRRYSLAIPLMLAQIDGMCADAFGLSLFMGHHRRAIGDRLATGDEEWLAVTAPLLSLGTVVAQTRDRVIAHDEFNRHAILHGLIVDYGTHLNSCKAISLLGYINVVVRRWRETASRAKRRHRAG